MTKRAIFTLETKDAMDMVESDDKFPFTFDCFFVTQSHYDFGDLDPRKLPEDLNPMNEEPVKADIASLAGFMMRTRFNSRCNGPYMIRVPDCYNYPEREQVEEIVRSWYKNGSLKEKLTQAKI